MKLFRTLGQSMSVRLGASIMLALAALGLFLLNRSTFTGGSSEVSAEVAADVDREVDSVLARFNIEKGWVKKIPIPNGRGSRIERRVGMPSRLMGSTVQMNVAFSSMARKYHGRAIASENLRENSVTIHIEMDGFIVQTIIFKTNPALNRVARKE